MGPPPDNARTVPTLNQIFAKLYPTADTPQEERILLTGMLIGLCARLENEVEILKTELRTLQRSQQR